MNVSRPWSRRAFRLVWIVGTCSSAVLALLSPHAVVMLGAVLLMVVPPAFAFGPLTRRWWWLASTFAILGGTPLLWRAASDRASALWIAGAFLLAVGAVLGVQVWRSARQTSAGWGTALVPVGLLLISAAYLTPERARRWTPLPAPVQAFQAPPPLAASAPSREPVSATREKASAVTVGYLPAPQAPEAAPRASKAHGAKDLTATASGLRTAVVKAPSLPFPAKSKSAATAPRSAAKPTARPRPGRPAAPPATVSTSPSSTARPAVPALRAPIVRAQTTAPRAPAPNKAKSRGTRTTARAQPNRPPRTLSQREAQRASSQRVRDILNARRAQNTPIAMCVTAKRTPANRCPLPALNKGADHTASRARYVAATPQDLERWRQESDGRETTPVDTRPNPSQPPVASPLPDGGTPSLPSEPAPAPPNTPMDPIRPQPPVHGPTLPELPLERPEVPGLPHHDGGRQEQGERGKGKEGKPNGEKKGKGRDR